jgi:hypothetical protein
MMLLVDPGEGKELFWWNSKRGGYVNDTFVKVNKRFVCL